MRSLTIKLTLAFLLVSLTGIVLVGLLVWGINSAEFNRFMIDRGLNSYTTAVTSYYEKNGSWIGVDEYLRQQGQISSSNSPEGNGPLTPTPFVLVDSNGQVILPSGRFQVGDQLNTTQFNQRVAIIVNQQVVGYVLVTGRPPSPGPLETRYLDRTNQALILAALGAMVIAVLLALILARTITRPVRDLTLASSAMAKGQLNQQVQVRSKDELGELTKTFNKMSADLEHSNQLRQQMTADIAHDLRTPLSVIIGYLEGLKDGVIKPNTKRFTAMYDEALYLQRLVEDLRTLSLADSGELSMTKLPVQPGELIERLTSSFQHQADQNHISLKTSIESDLPSIYADPERLQEALGNLVTNALRYTPQGGEINLSASRDGDHVCITVKDNGAGIAPDDLPHIFERFYRGDDSRQEGGSGLGLAIAKSIIELQGGKIAATSDGPGTGSVFTIKILIAS